MSHERSVEAPQWKPADTGGNRVVSQRDFGGVAVVELRLIEPHIVSRGTFTGMLNECLRLDGRDDQEIARAVSISKGYLSKLLRSVWWAQVRRFIRFMRETRCVAPLQWIADDLGFELRAKKSALEMERDAALARAAELEQRILNGGRAAA